MVPQTTFSGKIGPTLKILVPPYYGIVIANKLVNNLSIISVQSEHDNDKMQYHEVLVERDRCTWYIDAGLCVVPPLTTRALDPMCVWQLWHPTNTVYWDFIY